MPVPTWYGINKSGHNTSLKQFSQEKVMAATGYCESRPEKGLFPTQPTPLLFIYVLFHSLTYSQSHWARAMCQAAHTGTAVGAEEADGYVFTELYHPCLREGGNEKGRKKKI